MADVLILALLCCIVVGRLRRARPAARSEARQLGPYVLGDEIGRGATGVVYRARHALLQRWCAVKLLAREVSERELERFEREVRLTAQLSHPNTVSVYDFGRAPDGTFYYVMELLDGLSLQQLVEQYGPQPPERVIHILLQLCASLREAHGAGLIHRDIKPANVMLCRQGGVSDVAKLVDFGLVKELKSDVDPGETDDLVVGTPLYMSPEAIVAPRAVTPRSDLYGLGAVAYFLLTGAPVFEGENVIEVCGHHLHSTPERPSRLLGRSIAPDLERIVLDCLAKNPLERPAGALELAARLERCADARAWGELDAQLWWEHPESASEQSQIESVISGLRELRSVMHEHARVCA